MVGPTGLPGEADLFFENVGHGRFVEAADRHGLTNRSRAYGYGVVATDYDDDGFVDLFVANDSNPNFLYHNLGNGRFESVGLEAGVAVNGDGRAQAGMGADAGDYDGDSRVDLLLTTFAHDRYTLYRSLDGRHFEDASAGGHRRPNVRSHGLGRGLHRRRSRSQTRSVLRQRPHFFRRRSIPAARRDVSAKEPAVLESRRSIPRRVGSRGCRPAARRGRPRARHRGSRQRWRRRYHRQQHGRAADVTREPAADEASLAGDTRRGPGREPIRDRCESHRDRWGHEADARIRSGGSFLSQNDLRRPFGLRRDTPVPWTWRFACRAGAAGSRNTSPSDRLHLLTLADAAAIPQPPRAR